MYKSIVRVDKGFQSLASSRSLVCAIKHDRDHIIYSTVDCVSGKNHGIIIIVIIFSS